jgi:hypothetical protein
MFKWYRTVIARDFSFTIHSPIAPNDIVISSRAICMHARPPLEHETRLPEQRREDSRTLCCNPTTLHIQKGGFAWPVKPLSWRLATDGHAKNGFFSDECLLASSSTQELLCLNGLAAAGNVTYMAEHTEGLPLHAIWRQRRPTSDRRRGEVPRNHNTACERWCIYML